ncbi:MAG: VCBS repeat-containing protein [Pyrinomonadaceae bacterium]
MFKNWVGKFDKKIFYTIAVLSLTAAALLFAATYNTADAQGKGDDGGKATNAAPAATFAANAGTLGAIPDNLPGTPRDVTFTVSGITGVPSNVEVSHTYLPVHSWAGDLNVSLIAPNGNSFVIYGRTGQTGASAGDSSDLSGPYNFKDSAAGTNWWAAAFAAGAAAVIPPGDYRTTQSGPQPVTTTSPATNLTAAFAGVANANGTWTLRFTDNAAGDTGSVSAATLTIVGLAVPLDANADFDGDGRTDYVVARGTTTPFAEGAESERVTREIVNRPRSDLEEREVKGRRRAAAENVLAPPIFWYIALNPSGAVSGAQWGDAATDFITPEDFDGDGRDDISVWREAGSSSAFYILQSQTSTVRIDTFGLTGDDPAIVGDYDGDNKADPAVFRCPGIADPDGQCFFFYRGSNANPGGNITYVPWGFGVDGDFFPLVGDFDGDGKNDFCIQGSNPSAPTQGLFYLAKSAGGIEYVNWGLSSDFLIPGDYDGDGKADICVRRTVSGARQHFLLTRTGATSQVQWGITGDSSAPGDYDGDGKTDFAIWRPNADPSQNYFWVSNSSNGSTTVREWGQQADFPVAGWAVH